MAERPQVGFIGAGIMGAPMAGHLLKAGYSVTVHTRTRAKAEPLLSAGAAWAASPAEAADGADFLLTIVTDTPDVEQVLFGQGGAATSLASGAIVVDMTTISPSITRTLNERLEQQGVSLLDAPVTGGDVGAQNGTLTVMCGGSSHAFERAQPLLQTFGKNVVHVGPSGAGQALKACNQILCAVNMIGVCEALTLAEQSGLDLNTALETLSGGAGGSWAWSQLGTRIANGDLDPAFMVRLIQKDLRIVQETAQQLSVSLPGTALAQQLFRAVEAQDGGGDRGTQAMINVYRALRPSR